MCFPLPMNVLHVPRSLQAIKSMTENVKNQDRATRIISELSAPVHPLHWILTMGILIPLSFKTTLICCSRVVNNNTRLSTCCVFWTNSTFAINIFHFNPYLFRGSTEVMSMCSHIGSVGKTTRSHPLLHLLLLLFPVGALSFIRERSFFPLVPLLMRR